MREVNAAVRSWVGYFHFKTCGKMLTQARDLTWKSGCGTTRQPVASKYQDEGGGTK